MAVIIQDTSPEITADHGTEKDIDKGERSAAASDADNNSDINKQDGVRNVEAVTVVWEKKMLWVTFVL